MLASLRVAGGMAADRGPSGGIPRAVQAARSGTNRLASPRPRRRWQCPITDAGDRDEPDRGFSAPAPGMRPAMNTHKTPGAIRPVAVAACNSPDGSRRRTTAVLDVSCGFSLCDFQSWQIRVCPRQGTAATGLLAAGFAWSLTLPAIRGCRAARTTRRLSGLDPGAAGICRMGEVPKGA